VSDANDINDNSEATKHDVLKWVSGVAAAVIASLVATYFSTQSSTEHTVRERLTVVETKQELQAQEVLRRLDQLDGKFEKVLQEWARGVDRRTGEPLPLQTYIEQNQRPPR
jgi:hypothetical protein